MYIALVEALASRILSSATLRTAALFVERNRAAATVWWVSKELGEYALYDFAVDKSLELWEEKEGEISNGTSTFLSVFLPVLLQLGRKQMTRPSRKRSTWSGGNHSDSWSTKSSYASGTSSGKKGKISSFADLAKSVPASVINQLRKLPYFTNIAKYLKDLGPLKNYSYFRDLKAQTITFCNHMGQPILVVSEKGIKLASRVGDAILAKKGKAFLSTILVGGGTSVGLKSLFNEDGLTELSSNYFATVGQMFEEIGGLHDTSAPKLNSVKLGDIWYDDLGSLNETIITNYRYVIRTIAQSSGMSEDDCNDVIASVLADGPAIVRGRAVRAIDLTGELSSSHQSVLTSEDVDTHWYSWMISLFAEEASSSEESEDSDPVDELNEVKGGSKDEKSEINESRRFTPGSNFGTDNTDKSIHSSDKVAAESGDLDTLVSSIRNDSFMGIRGKAND